MVKYIVCSLFLAISLQASQHSNHLSFLNQVLAAIATMKELPNDAQYYIYLKKTVPDNKERKEQFEERYKQHWDATIKLALCHAMFHMNDQRAIFELPDIKKRFEDDISFLESQLPQKFNEDLTLKPRVFEPMKCFHALSYLIDSWRPVLEQHPLCELFYAKINYDVRKYKTFDYTTQYYISPYSNPPKKSRSVKASINQTINQTQSPNAFQDPALYGRKDSDCPIS